MRLEDQGDRITHAVQHALPTPRLASSERAELLRLTQSLDDIVDLIEHAAHELPQADALPRDHVARAGGVLKDLVRTTLLAVERIEQPPATRAPLHIRAHELALELRVELRTAQRALVDRDDNPLASVRAGDLLRRLHEIGRACTRALLVVEVLAGTHA
jgi:uncharacterized protein Yka (UPF0111/DUF47 family)